MSRIRIGIPQYISVRPLIYGLIRSPHKGVEIIYDEPAVLSGGLERGELDVALIPSVEYMRGVGTAFVSGPALVARPGGRGILLVSQKPIAEIERVAVHEFCRTPIAAVRIALDRVHNVTPDLLVEKNYNGDWREHYDAILMSGDSALDYISRPAPAGLETHNVTDLWGQVTPHPLVLGLWVYTNKELEATFSKWLMTSRNLGLQNLSRLADGIAATTHYQSELLYDYFANSWSYNLDKDGLEALRALEELAVEYDLVREGRFAPAKVPVKVPVT